MRRQAKSAIIALMRPTKIARLQENTMKKNSATRIVALLSIMLMVCCGVVWSALLAAPPWDKKDK